MWTVNPATAPRAYVAMINNADGVPFTGEQCGNVLMTENKGPAILSAESALFPKNMTPEFG